MAVKSLIVMINVLYCLILIIILRTERYTTSSGTIIGGNSSTYAEDKSNKKYTQSLVTDGTAYLPLMLDNDADKLVLYQNYYEDTKQSIENQKNPLLRKDRRKEKKKGINNCGVAKGSITNIKNELNKRLEQLITDPQCEQICKIHETNFTNYKETNITLKPYELCVTWDGKTTKKSTAGNNRTQVHMLFGNLHEYFAGSPKMTFMILDVAFTDKNKCAKRAIKEYVIEFIEENVHNTIYTINILSNTKTLSFPLIVDVNADRPAKDSFDGVLGFNSWCPVSNIVIYDVRANTKQFIDILSPQFNIKSIADEHTYSFEIKNGKMPKNIVRVHISDIPGFDLELKKLVEKLNKVHFVDYDNISSDKNSIEFKQYETKHKQRSKYAHDILGIPFVYNPCWFTIFCRIYDVLHFGIVKSAKYMTIIGIQILLLAVINKIVFINVFSETKKQFGEKWKSFLLENTKTPFHWTGPIWREIFLLLPNLFAVWEPLIKNDVQRVNCMHLFRNVQRFMIIMSIYCRLCFPNGIKNELIKKLRYIHPQMFLSDFILYRKGIIPMDFIGYLGLLPAQIEKVHRSQFNHGQFEFSTSKGESLNHLLAEMDKSSNGDWDGIVRKANQCGLMKMDILKTKKFNIEQIIREVKASRVEIWNDEIKKTFDDVANKFSNSSKYILKILTSHDWRQNPEIPRAIQNILNGSKAISGVKRKANEQQLRPQQKRRKMSTYLSKLRNHSKI